MVRERIEDALHALDLLDSRLAGKTAQQLQVDELFLDACSFRVCVLGEAVDQALILDRKNRRLFDRERLPKDMSWDGLVAVRNSFIHQYSGITAQALLMLRSGIPAYRLGLSNIRGQLPRN